MLFLILLLSLLLFGLYGAVRMQAGFGKDGNEKSLSGKEKPLSIVRGEEHPFWITAYLASWQHDAGTPYSNWGVMRVEDIDWNAFTHLIYFALPAGPDGTPGYSLDPADRNNLNTDRIAEIVPAAHRHGRKILLSVGGAGNYEGFSSAIREENRSRFIGTLAGFILEHGFDGIDLDMEPIERSDYDNYQTFVRELHAAFSAIETRSGDRPLITIAALKGSELAELYAGVQDLVDQINLMTYDMAMPWRRWRAWHNSALFSHGVRFPFSRREMPSVDRKVRAALEAGISAEKLGIGIDFYGYVWHGVNRLGRWRGWPFEDMSIIERPGGVAYSELSYRFDLDTAQWDEIAETSYLDLSGPRKFVSFDNEKSSRRKLRYAAESGLGGVILWELGGGFFPDHPPGFRDPLLQAIRSEWHKLQIEMEIVHP